MTTTQFRGPLSFLSNMHLIPITIDFGGGMVLSFPCVENAFQACKCAHPSDRAVFCTLSPAEARAAGQKVTLRPGWTQDGERLQYMAYCVAQKFKDQALAQQLVDLDPSYLTEINPWGDTFWGVSNGVGEDHLGRILRKVREDLLQAGYQRDHHPVSAPQVSPLYPWQDKVMHENDLPLALDEFGDDVYAVTGHRPKDLKAYKAERMQAYLADQLRTHLPQGRKVALIVGGAAGVDQDMHVAANTLIREGWLITVITAMPFDGQWQRWPKWAQDKFHVLVATSAHVIVLADNPGDDRTLAIQLLLERDAFMVDHSRVLLAMWNGKGSGGTFHTRKYALSLGVPVVELYAGWEQYALPVLPTRIENRTFLVKIGSVSVPHTMAQRDRSVSLTLAPKGDQVEVRLESEDIGRTVKVNAAPGPDLVTSFRAITAGLSSLKAGTPVTIHAPIVRDLLRGIQPRANAGFLDRHGKDIPFRPEWETLWNAMKDREVHVS